LRENGQIYRYETFAMYRQRYYDHTLTFASWQHLAISRGARFDVHRTTSFHVENVEQFLELLIGLNT